MLFPLPALFLALQFCLQHYSCGTQAIHSANHRHLARISAANGWKSIKLNDDKAAADIMLLSKALMQCGISISSFVDFYILHLWNFNFPICVFSLSSFVKLHFLHLWNFNFPICQKITANFANLTRYIWIYR